MNILQNLFKKKAQTVNTYHNFWNWFKDNEKVFFNVVKQGENIERDFFDHLASRLSELRDGFYYLTGMADDNTAELIFTADGAVENIVYVEELVDAAPRIPGWKFTALKPPVDIKNVNIRMGDYVFGLENLFFYSNEYAGFPDEIDITVVYNDYEEESASTILNGVYIFLDNFLGELNSVITIDNLTVIGTAQATKELIPIEKLKDFLIWRQKEFVEKYDVLRYDSENDSYASLTAELGNGKPLIAVVNTSLLEWDGKASHPWVLTLEIKYNGETSNGLPDHDTGATMDQIEEEMMEELKEAEGYLNVARQTADNCRSIFFACKDFRKPSKIADRIKKKYSERLGISFSIYKDKYWQTLDMFRVS